MFSGRTIQQPGVNQASRPSSIMGGLWILAVVVRVLAIGVLLAGPWTDQPEDLVGWDVARFQAIAERDQPGWDRFPIEYPPGSVLVIDAIAGDSTVDTSRRLVLVSAAAELIAVVVLWHRFGVSAATAFLILGLPLVPMGYVRLDLVVVALAVAAAAVLLSGAPDGDRGSPLGPGGPEPGWSSPTGADVGFGILVAAGAMVKLWPALLVLAAVAVGRRVAAVAAIAISGLAGVTWLVVVGDGVSPVEQVLSLRGATGWHVESLPGAVVALVTDQPARLELNAFRIGTLVEPVVTTGRLVALATMGGLVMVGVRSRLDATARVAVVMLGAVAALLVTAPLLSPQFILWLTPWAAILAGLQPAPSLRVPLVVSVVAGVVLVTGVTLLVFGPPNLDSTVAAAALTARNLGLVAVPVLCIRLLRRTEPSRSG